MQEQVSYITYIVKTKRRSVRLGVWPWATTPNINLGYINLLKFMSPNNIMTPLLVVAVIPLMSPLFWAS